MPQRRGRLPRPHRAVAGDAAHHLGRRPAVQGHVLVPLPRPLLRRRRRQARRRRRHLAARPRRRRDERVGPPAVDDRDRVGAGQPPGGRRGRRRRRDRRDHGPGARSRSSSSAATSASVLGDTDPQEALRDHVAKQIGAIAKPKRVLVVQELPKTRSGKIMRRLLRDVAENRELGDVTTLTDAGGHGPHPDRAAAEGRSLRGLSVPSRLSPPVPWARRAGKSGRHERRYEGRRTRARPPGAPPPRPERPTVADHAPTPPAPRPRPAPLRPRRPCASGSSGPARPATARSWPPPCGPRPSAAPSCSSPPSSPWCGPTCPSAAPTRRCARPSRTTAPSSSARSSSTSTSRCRRGPPTGCSPSSSSSSASSSSASSSPASLRRPSPAALPILAAVGGMAVPALVLRRGGLAGGPEALRGWAIPSATDIAFALAVLAVIGSRLPARSGRSCSPSPWSTTCWPSSSSPSSTPTT